MEMQKLLVTLGAAAAATATVALAGALGSDSFGVEKKAGLSFEVNADGASTRSAGYNCDEDRGECYSQDQTLPLLSVKGAAADEFAKFLASEEGADALQARLEKDFDITSEQVIDVVNVSSEGKISLYNDLGEELSDSNILSIAFKNVNDGIEGNEEAVVLTQDYDNGVKAQVVTAFYGPEAQLGFQ